MANRGIKIYGSIKTCLSLKIFCWFFFSQLERQLHEDEEFAKTLAMLDETPQKKKVKFFLDCSFWKLSFWEWSYLDI